MSDDIQLSPTRPYLARAIYQWICDHQLTPYLLVDATQPFVQVPTQHIRDGQIVLNIAPHAVGQFNMDNDAIFFNARFGGVAQELYIPMSAVMGLYSRENGQGLFFDPTEYDNVDNLAEQRETIASKAVDADASTAPNHNKKPSFKILD